jgi:hypothetical protein
LEETIRDSPEGHRHFPIAYYPSSLLRAVLAVTASWEWFLNKTVFVI